MRWMVASRPGRANPELAVKLPRRQPRASGRVELSAPTRRSPSIRRHYPPEERPMSAPEQFDAIVIGAGQAGGPLATALAKAGRRTVLIEREHVGGTCINEGCTP